MHCCNQLLIICANILPFSMAVGRQLPCSSGFGNASTHFISSKQRIAFTSVTGQFVHWRCSIESIHKTLLLGRELVRSARANPRQLRILINSLRWRPMSLASASGDALRYTTRSRRQAMVRMAEPLPAATYGRLSNNFG